jgi:hypothetical protein
MYPLAHRVVNKIEWKWPLDFSSFAGYFSEISNLPMAAPSPNEIYEI